MNIDGLIPKTVYYATDEHVEKTFERGNLYMVLKVQTFGQVVIFHPDNLPEFMNACLQSNWKPVNIRGIYDFGPRIEVNGNSEAELHRTLASNFLMFTAEDSRTIRISTFKGMPILIDPTVPEGSIRVVRADGKKTIDIKNLGELDA